MSEHIIVVESLKDWRWNSSNAVIVKAKDYLAQGYLKNRNAKVINLCRNYRYLSLGYYCSLLAEARRHKVIPSVRTLTDLSSKRIYSLSASDLDSLVQRTFSRPGTDNGGETIEIRVFFGRSQNPEFQEIARQLFDLFPCPLFKVELRKSGRWQIHAIKPEHLQNFSDENALFFADALNQYLSKRWREPKSPSTNRFDLAVLHNPSEALAPSDKRALERFVKAGRKLDVNVELIERKDYGRLGEYDALFIRETTNIDHYTYRFSKKAASEGMVVIDDPNSIVRCTNKVYLAELLAVHNIPAPKTVIIQKQNHAEYLSLIEAAMTYPVVLKIPDGSFSRGVFKAENRRELEDIAAKLYRESDLILAQEFVYTLFDWRIGMLNRKPIYACQYFMIKEHWQIMKHDPSGKSDAGRFKTLPVAEVPAAVINAATAAAGLIGDGLYGVDLKQSDNGVYVIEVNDNPNIESGVEDAVLGDDLYRIIMEEFVRRIELRRTR